MNHDITVNSSGLVYVSKNPKYEGLRVADKIYTIDDQGLFAKKYYFNGYPVFPCQTSTIMCLE